MYCMRVDGSDQNDRDEIKKKVEGRGRCNLFRQLFCKPRFNMWKSSRRLHIGDSAPGLLPVVIFGMRPGKSENIKKMDNAINP